MSIGEDQFLGHPISYWLNLKQQVETKGVDFDRILVDALVQNEQLKRDIVKLHKDFREIRTAIQKATAVGDFLLGNDPM